MNPPPPPYVNRSPSLPVHVQDVGHPWPARSIPPPPPTILHLLPRHPRKRRDDEDESSSDHVDARCLVSKDGWILPRTPFSRGYTYDSPRPGD
ncbi:unnamed protein product [Linum trigynum]|uniref:Uncharacterized protein n=1 Tax=Linum trigynum TaxID=586398 RepID=A0AAV2F4G6_9ROSI